MYPRGHHGERLLPVLGDPSAAQVLVRGRVQGQGPHQGAGRASEAVHGGAPGMCGFEGGENPLRNART